MPALLVLVAVAILVGLGFVAKSFFVVAGALLVVWIAGWFLRRAGRRWYYW